jgi:hypothetical protein
VAIGTVAHASGRLDVHVGLVKGVCPSLYELMCADLGCIKYAYEMCCSPVGRTGGLLDGGQS